MRWASIKMRSPAFPPRRPSAILRYLIPAFIIITFFYYFHPAQDYSEAVPPLSNLKPPSSASQLNNPPANGQISHQSPAGKDAEIPSEHTAKEMHDVNQPKPKPAAPDQEPIADSSGKDPYLGEDHSDQPKQTATKGSHPIDHLIDAANKRFDDMISRESHSLNEAAAAYRRRRGRHPPPGFDAWYKYAQDRNAVMVEDFWDQIYHDLEPFWALPPNEIRKGAWDYEMTIKVRNGVATAESDWFWTLIWLSLIQTIQHLLPDMDIALNAMDEPRLVVPWEKMNEFMNKANAERGMVSPKDALNEFARLPQPGEGPDKDLFLPSLDWEGTKPYWKVVQRGCAPDSATRQAEVITNWDHPPIFTPSYAEPHMYKGFVSNYTLSTSVCHQPDIQGLNGIFIDPLTVSATKTLFPMFGGSKLSVNNEILLPAPMYWNEEERFTGGGVTGGEWKTKFDGVVWRGVATGGRNRPDNWKAFQRHRFVAMNNATKITRAEEGIENPANFELPSSDFGLAAQQHTASPDSRKTDLAAWVGLWADVAFVDLMCEEEEEGGQCYYTSPSFSVQEGIRLADQFNWKYLPDIDGNSFSGRYLGFLRSTSLPIKATVYREWHDSRLVAWKHFVPMDNRYSEWFGIIEYFLGYKNERPAHDAEAAAIAKAGKEWAEKVLRREDMQIYTLRLLLEYARVSDERRHKMGWAEDLKSKSTGEGR